jgi:hypothetical protein
LIIRLIIQTILLYPSGAVWTDEAPNVNRPDPTGAISSDCEHPSRNWKVAGLNSTYAPSNRRHVRRELVGFYERVGASMPAAIAWHGRGGRSQ